ncbi:MAG: AAA family ATPase [Pseudomonadota bacterium]
MYEQFYDLDRRPFMSAPDPDFLYWSSSHSSAFTMLRYGIVSRAPITVITGDIGAGKTTLIRQLLNELPEELTVGLVSNMQAGRGELLEWVMMALDQEIDAPSYVALFRRFQDMVIQAYAEGRRVLLIFDEAQNLGVEALEELRMLSNINAERDELLQIVLVGQPQLRQLIERPELTQFSQRISADFDLQPLSKDDVANYIDRRLEAAGASWEIFARHTCELIHEATGGVPRLINILCDLCLVYSYAAERKIVDDDILREFLNMAKARGIYRRFSPVRPVASLVK